MKLRLETGNFKITGTIDHEANTVTIDDLPKGLSQEDFIGCVADMGTDGLCAILQTREPEENVVAFFVSMYEMNYNCLTGKVTMNIGPTSPGGDGTVI